MHLIGHINIIGRGKPGGGREESEREKENSTTDQEVVEVIPVTGWPYTSDPCVSYGSLRDQLVEGGGQREAKHRHK